MTDKYSTKRPHAVTISCMLELSVVQDNGIRKPIKFDPDVKKQYGVQSSFLLTCTGFDLNDCLQKLKKKIEQFNAD
jgi:hypothetical protein